MKDGNVLVVEPCSEFDGASGTCISTNEPLPSVSAGVDSIIIRYKSESSNLNSTVQLRGCYSAYSSQDRPWRKQESIINDNFKKRCSVDIIEDLDITTLPDGNFAGEYTWTPGKASGPSFYTIQAFEVCSNGSFCAYGQAPGYYEIIPIDSTPSWLRGLVGFLICIGPISLALFIFVESKMKKNV